MSTATKQRSPESKATDGKHQYVDFDEYVDFHLARTRSGIKYTEILTALGWIATLGLCYLLTFTVFDHWLVEGGISRSARLWLLVSATTLTAGWIGWKVIVPYLRQINFLYAAREIEKSAPSLKGGLVNLVDLQHAGKKIPDHVRVAIEKRAALELSQVEVEHAVDRGPLMRVSYLLLFVVTVCCLYTLFSPKDILASVKRAILPASDTAPPTQTRITDVEPGNVSVVARSSVSVRANVSGRNADEVTLFYSTSDGKYVDEPILMRREQEGLSTFTGLLAGENARGLLQDVSYRIEAGDAATEDFTITVVQPPSARVESVSYVFPSYMQLENRTEVTGHINGWEGTEVTVRAVTNIPVKSAKIVFVDGDQPTGEEVRMKVSNRNQLSAKWPLEIRSDGTFAPHYWIECRTADDRTDPSPTRYNVLIKPDAPPEIAMLAPQRDLQMPVNGMVPIRYRAADPDFQLRSVKLIVAKDGDRIIEEPLAEENEIGKSIQGLYKWKLEPLNLSVGDRLQFWLEAKDNRIPRANTKATHRLNVEIIEPVSEEEAEEQFQQEQQKQEQQEQQQQEPSEETDKQDSDQQQPQEGEDQAEESGDEGESQSDQRSEKNGDQGEATDEAETEPGEGDQGEGDKGAGLDENSQSSSDEGDGKRSGEKSLDPESLEDQEKALEQILEHERKQQEKEKGTEQNEQEKQDRQQSSDAEKKSDEQQEGIGEQKEDGKGDSAQQGKKSSENSDPPGQQQEQNQSKQEQPNEQNEKKPDENQQGVGEQGEQGGKSPGGEQSKPGESGKGESGEDPSGQGPAGGDKASDKQKPAPGKSKPQTGGDETGSEKPTAENPDAEQKPATGDEQGRGKATDDETANKANKPLDREGDKNEAGRKAGDPNQKPQAREQGNPNDPQAENAQSQKQPNDNEQGEAGKGESNRDQQKQKGNPKQTDPQESPSETQPSDQKSDPRKDEKAKPLDQTDNSGEDPKGEGEKQQKSKQPDEGEKGESSKGEQGKEESQTPGPGEESQQKGDPQADSVEDSKGKPGKKPGEGSESKPSAQAGKQAGDQPGGQGEKSTQEPGDPSEQRGGQSGGANPPKDPGGEPAGGGDGDVAEEGEPGANNNPPNESPSDPEPEKAKLEYSKKATNLVLDRLKDQLQRGEPDQELLKKLGWTEEQLRSFTDRMQDKLKDDGSDTSPTAVAQRRQFQEMLKDLHTKPAAKRQAASNKAQQRVKQLDTKTRTPIPRRFRSRYRQYTQSFKNLQMPKSDRSNSKTDAKK